MTNPEIDVLVARLEAATAAARARARTRGTAAVVEELGSGLGTLRMTGMGELLSIEFDTRAFKRTTAAALAAAVVGAVQRAERRAADQEPPRHDDEVYEEDEDYV